MLEENCVRVTRVELSVGSLDLFRFADYLHAFPRHSHEGPTVGVFDKPNGRIFARGASWQASEGALLALGCDETHSAEPLRESGWSYRSICPDHAIVDHAIEGDSSRGSALFSNPVIRDAQLAARLLSLHCRLESSKSTSLGAEEELLCVLRDMMDRHGAKSSSVDSRRCMNAVRRARTYLEENYQRQVKLRELSGFCDVSAFHLIRSFRDIVGIPPHAYLMQVRVNRARELLLQGDALSSVAYSCGFSDQSHLTRTFKKILGVTPGAYASARSRE